MSKPSPRRLKKKKEREKEAKKKVLARRNAIRAEKIEENKYKKKLKRVSQLQKEMGDLSQWADDVLMNMNNNTLSQLEKNAKILKELEKEYEVERSKKQKLNDDLEQKGLLSLNEKLNFLHNELVEEQKSAHENSGKEIADVTICKAPDFQPENEIVQENSEQP